MISPSLNLPQSSHSYKILAVGNDLGTLEASASVLLGAGYGVSSVTLQQTLNYLDSEQFDAVVLCHTLKSREVSAVLALVKSVNHNLPVVQIYSHAPDPAFRFVAPSYNPSSLLSVLSWALQRDVRATA